MADQTGRGAGNRVDNRAEVRDFLTSRRARITPEQAGLPLYGTNRRVSGLRREEVALLAGVSTDYYTRLERGNLVGVSESVLEALAGALRRLHPRPWALTSTSGWFPWAVQGSTSMFDEVRVSRLRR
jgi:transcriptional regulator with XRE-family HTH domain